jgi:NhaP-type Na+/H+ and K+/H+ antiporter
MLLLLSFVAFGTSPIWSGLEVLSVPAVLFAVVALFGRTAVLQLVLPRREVDAGMRRLIVWYGPRGLSSLLLVLLPVFAGIPGSERLFQICALVVLFSVLGHGTMLLVVIRTMRSARTPRPVTPASVATLSHADLVADRERITLEEMTALRRAGAPVVLVDLRRENDFASLGTKARGAVRVHPDKPVESAAALALPREAWLVAYCA